MTTVANNILQNVITYQKAELAWQLNSYCAINIANKKFMNFQEKEGNLGQTVNFELAPRGLTSGGLIANFTGVQQRLKSLSCIQAANSAIDFDEQQLTFNDIDEYMRSFGMAQSMELGTEIERDILKNIVGGSTCIDVQNPLFGQVIDPTSTTYLFYGNGIDPINSFQQLAQAQVNFTNIGASKVNPCAIIPDVVVPSIIQNGLSQFAIDRNNELAEEWEFAKVGKWRYMQSNLMPTHISGNVGNNSTVLTVVSTNDPTGNNITQITCSGASASDANAILQGDLAQFVDNVGSLPNLRYRQPIGHGISQQPVQFTVTSGSQADSSGNVVLNIFPALQSTPGLNQNLNVNIQAGMNIKFVPSHVAGVIMSGNPIYVAVPRLSDQDPYKTVRYTDEETGMSMRHYWGAIFGNNVKGYIRDQIWGSCLVAENALRLVFPLSQF